MGRSRISFIDMGVGGAGSRAAEITSKMEHFVIIVSGFPSWLLQQS